MIKNNISKLGLGTVQFGRAYGLKNNIIKKQVEINKILDLLKKNNVSILDTSSNYLDSEKKIGNGTKKWLINQQGAGDGLLDLSSGLLNITQIRFAVHPSRLPNKMCFSNHVLYRVTDPNILEWGTIDGNKIPQNILDEVKEKSKEVTYDLDWKKNDFVMLDNKRFTHGRRAFKKSDKRDIMTVESSSTNFGYGSTTRTKLN